MFLSGYGSYWATKAFGPSINTITVFEDTFSVNGNIVGHVANVNGTWTDLTKFGGDGIAVADAYEIVGGVLTTKTITTNPHASVTYAPYDANYSAIATLDTILQEPVRLDVEFQSSWSVGVFPRILLYFTDSGDFNEYVDVRLQGRFTSTGSYPAGTNDAIGYRLYFEIGTDGGRYQGATYDVGLADPAFAPGVIHTYRVVWTKGGSVEMYADGVLVVPTSDYTEPEIASEPVGQFDQLILEHGGTLEQYNVAVPVGAYVNLDNLTIIADVIV